jgi:hypothetical protein
MEDIIMDKIKHIKSGFGKSSKLDNHPSTLDDVLNSESDNMLDTPELIVLNRISIGLRYNRNMRTDILEDLPLMRVPIHMELFHEYSQGRKREPHLRLVLYFAPLKENSKGKIEISYNKTTRKLEGEGTAITLDVPMRYGEIVGQYDCYSIVENGEKILSKFIDREVKKHIKEYGYPHISKHGFAEDEKKMTKIIALAPREDNENNG